MFASAYPGGTVQYPNTIYCSLQPSIPSYRGSFSPYGMYMPPSLPPLQETTYPYYEGSQGLQQPARSLSQQGMTLLDTIAEQPQFEREVGKENKTLVQRVRDIFTNKESQQGAQLQSTETNWSYGNPSYGYQNPSYGYQYGGYQPTPLYGGAYTSPTYPSYQPSALNWPQPSSLPLNWPQPSHFNWSPPHAYQPSSLNWPSPQGFDYFKSTAPQGWTAPMAYNTAYQPSHLYGGYAQAYDVTRQTLPVSYHAPLAGYSSYQQPAGGTFSTNYQPASLYQNPSQAYDLTTSGLLNQPAAPQAYPTLTPPQPPLLPQPTLLAAQQPLLQTWGKPQASAITMPIQQVEQSTF